MAFVVIYDACVLFPFHQRDLLIRLAQTDLVQAKWTDRILEECFRAIAEQRPDLDPERLARTRDLMNAAVRDVRVDGYQSLEQSIELPDRNDRHVVATAIKAHAQVIVTDNLQDFPAPTLEPYGLEAQSPDEFARHLFDLDARGFVQILHDMVAPLTQPPLTVEQLLEILERDGLVETVEAVRAHLS